MTAAGLQVCYAVGRVLRRMEYLVVDSALGTGWLAGKSNERPIAVLDDFLSAAELQPLLAQLPDNPNEYLHAAMRDGTAKSNDGKGIALQVDVEAAVMRKLRAAMFAGADTELTTAEQTRLPVLISAGDCAEHRDRFVSDSDGYSPDKLVYGYAAFVYLAGGEDSTLFFRHDSGKVESVACAPGRMVVFKNLAVRHWVEGPMEQARVMLGPFAMEPREGEIRQITAGSPEMARGFLALYIASMFMLVILIGTIFSFVSEGIGSYSGWVLLALWPGWVLLALLLGYYGSAAASLFLDGPWIAVTLMFMIVAVLSGLALLYWVFESVGSHTGFVLSKSVLAAIGLSPIAVWVAFVTLAWVAQTLSQWYSGTGAGYNDIPDSLDRDASKGTAEQTEDYVSHQTCPTPATEAQQ